MNTNRYDSRFERDGNPSSRSRYNYSADRTYVPRSERYESRTSNQRGYASDRRSSYDRRSAYDAPSGRTGTAQRASTASYRSERPGPARYRSSESYYSGNSYARSRTDARPQPASYRDVQSSRPSQRTSTMRRPERRDYPAARTASAQRYPARSGAPAPNSVRSRKSGAAGWINTIVRYLRIINSDVLGRRRWKLLPALYLPIACIYSELLLGLFGGIGLQGLIYKLFFGLASGAMLGGIALLFKSRIQKIIVHVELFLVALLFIVQCLIRKEFQVYFPLSTILSNTADVVGNYGGDVFHSIITGLPVIILFLLPLVIYFVMTRRRSRRSFATGFKPIFAVQMIIISLIVWAMGMLCLAIGGDSAIYKAEFELTSTSDSIGLLTGFRLEEKYSLFGNNASESFDDLDLAAEAMAVVVPTQTIAPEASPAPSAEAVPAATEVAYGENSLGLDFAALNVGETDEDIANINTYLSTLTASKQNAYTGLFKGKNLIMICAEALSDAVIDPQLTPTLYRLTHNGIYFSQAYQPTWGGSTSSGEFSMLLGLVPTNSTQSMLDTAENNNYFTMGSQLNRLGYTSLCYHNGKYNYYDRDVTHTNLGYDQFLAHGNGLEEIAGKYPSDEEMISSTLDTYINQQPFSIYYMTCDGHKPYNEDDDARVTEHLQEVLAVYPNRYQQNTLNYICYQLELEDALAALVAKLEAAGIADDTVICICSDHYPYGLSRDGGDYISDLYGYEPQHPWDRDRNSIIIWSGCLENENKDMACEVSSPVYSLDILPTLSNLFGVEYDSRLLVGRDVFSDESPFVLWNNGSWLTEIGCYDAEEKVYYPTIPTGNDDAYVQQMSAKVKHKRSYSTLVKNNDYYQYIVDHLAS